MGLRINTNVPALNATRQLNRTMLRLSKSLERLSSGLRINRAADDAAGLAIAEGFRSSVLGFRVAQRNSQDAISLVQTAEGALSETTNILQRIRELAVQAATGTSSDENKAALQDEVDELIAQIDDIAADTEFNTINILDGSQATVTIQAGAQMGQTLAISLTGADSTDLALNAFAISAAAEAATAIQQVDSALATVSSIRAGLGAAQNRLEFTIATLAIQEENSSASESAIRDANIALETIEFTR
ncbi:MAG: flagellin FliC, partial [Candidatus Hydrogenedentes bacterium]|nr:flagellin FliC [Candidatus Hydrogenedentota bacterium]